MGRFTKRPVTIDAILAGEILDGADSGRFSRLNPTLDPMPDWVTEAFEKMVIGFELNAVLINTPEGQMRGERTDWIIRGVKGELYPCKPDIFEATYDAGEGRQKTEVLTVNVKGDISPEQFAKFRAEWEASHASVAKSMLVDAEPDTLVQKLNDQLDAAWGIIANAGEGNWNTQTPTWIKAAERWRDAYVAPASVDADTRPMIKLPNYDQTRSQNTDFKITHVAVTERGFEVGGITPIVDQPMPKPQGDKVAIWDLVIADFKQRFAHGLTIEKHETRDVLDDMTARDVIGRERYGTPLTAFNGRDPIIDAYQEQLDAAVYLRQALEEGASVREIYELTLSGVTRLRALINERLARMEK